MPEWVKGRTVVLLTAALVLVVAAVAIFVVAFNGKPGGSATTVPAGSGVVLTVDEALTAEAGQPLNVEGAILSTGGQTVLASGLSESSPPQAAGTTMPVKGLDLSKLVGLSSTGAGGGVTWSDYSPVLQGVVKNGALEVNGIPRVIEDTSIDNVKIRFSPVSEPINSGDQIWWVFDVTNTGTVPMNVVFPSGQRGDLILSQGEEDKYAWSDGKVFTQAEQTETLQPGKSLSIVLSDTLTLEPGTYDVAAQVNATIGPAGEESPPPDLETTITIH
jgi:hypothetical protein